MKWTIELEPILNQERFIKKFLWFPTKIRREARWLEFAYIKQRYSVKRGKSEIYPLRVQFWDNIEWITKQDYLKR